MNKEEILSRSRNEKKDEGVEYAESRARRIGELGMFAVYIIVIVYNMFKGLQNEVAFILFWTYFGFSWLGKYRVTHNTLQLVSAIFGIMAAILYFAGYIIATWWAYGR